MEYLMSVWTTGFWQLFCKVTFIGKAATFSLVCVLQYLSLPEDLLQFGKFYLLFFLLGSTIPENTKISSGVMNVYYETKIKSAGETKVFS